MVKRGMRKNDLRTRAKILGVSIGTKRITVQLTHGNHLETEKQIRNEIGEITSPLLEGGGAERAL